MFDTENLLFLFFSFEAFSRERSPILRLYDQSFWNS